MLQAMILLAEAEGAQQGPGWAPFVPIIAIGLVIYMLVLRPMKRQEQERQKLAGSLKKNDEVLTNSGIYGTVVDISETDDKITVRVADNVRLKMTKGSILRNLTNEEAAKAAKEVKT